MLTAVLRCRAGEIRRSLDRGSRFIKSIQREDGSWYGSWAVCFTYANWFGVWGLMSAGESYETSAAIRKCVEFTLSKQRENGGWGESYLSCQDKARRGAKRASLPTPGCWAWSNPARRSQVYSDLPEGRSHVVNTAWAMMTLIATGQQDRDRT